MKKKLFINYTFEENYNCLVHELDNSIVYCRNYINDEKDLKGLKDELDSLIKQENNDVEIIVLLHESNGIKTENLLNYNKSKQIKIYQFTEGNGFIYFKDSTENGLLDSGFISPYVFSDEKIIKKKFEIVWSYYWNYYEKEQLKKKIINLFLPLSIDMQGLKESNEGNLEEYTKAVIREIKKNKKKILLDWDEIKLPFKYDDLPVRLIAAITSTKFESDRFLKKYVYSDSNYLPTWLHNIVTDLEEQ